MQLARKAHLILAHVPAEGAAAGNGRVAEMVDCRPLAVPLWRRTFRARFLCDDPEVRVRLCRHRKKMDPRIRCGERSQAGPPPHHMGLSAAHNAPVSRPYLAA